MKIDISDNYQQLSERVAGQVVELVNRKPDAVLTFASGDSPLGLFRELVKRANKGLVDFSDCHFVGLDEWVGMDIHDEGSCQYVIYKELFTPLGIRQEQITYFDAKSDDPEGDCERVNREVARLGGIDLIVLGIGMNGHLGFNEPGVSEELYSLVIDLDDVTKVVGQKYFATEKKLAKGISLGLKQILSAGQVILIADAKKKASIIRQVVEGEISTQVPASVVRRHPDATLFIDREAASELTNRQK